MEQNRFFDVEKWKATNEIMLNNFLQLSKARENMITEAILNIHEQLATVNNRIDAVLVSHQELNDKAKRVFDRIERLTGNFEVEQ